MSEHIELSEEWAGWVINRDGMLYGPAWRRGFTPGDLNAWPYAMAELRVLRRQLAQLQKELARADSVNDELQQRIQWYRSQLIAESRLGFLVNLMR